MSEHRVTRKITTSVEIDWEDLLALCRKEVGAPADASVTIETYDSSIVTWTLEEPKA